MLQTLKHRSYIHYTDIKNCKHPDHRLIHKIANAGDDEVILIPFLSNNNDPVILLVLSGENMPVNDIVEYINEHRKEIENCLM